MAENEEVQTEQEDNRSLAELFFDIKQPEAETAAEETPTAEPEVVAEAEAIPEPIVAEEVTPEPVAEVETPKPEKKKLWTPEKEEETYELLRRKHQYKSLNDEQKALAFIAAKNPTLNEEELMFLAATDYGIGAESVPEDELTTEQISGIKRQAIERKKLIAEADGFFKQQAQSVELAEPEVDEDPEFTQYKEQRIVQAQQAEENEKTKATILQQIETNAKGITEIKDNLEIDIDDRKLPVELNFKVDEAKQKKLIEYATKYSPDKEEVAAFTEPTTGKFDYKGYLQSLAPRVFAKEMLASGIKQALAKDREQFIEKELKNSTLRNNDVSQTVERPVDANDAYWNAVGAKG